MTTYKNVREMLVAMNTPTEQLEKLDEAVAVRAPLWEEIERLEEEKDDLAERLDGAVRAEMDAQKEIQRLKAEVERLQPRSVVDHVSNVESRADALERENASLNVLIGQKDRLLVEAGQMLGTLKEERQRDQEAYEATMSETCRDANKDVEKHCTCVPYLRRGIQARDGKIAELRRYLDRNTAITSQEDAVAALSAVREWAVSRQAFQWAADARKLQDEIKGHG